MSLLWLLLVPVTFSLLEGGCVFLAFWLEPNGPQARGAGPPRNFDKEKKND